MSHSQPDPFPLHANRLVLRRFRATDIDDFQNYRGDLEVGRYQGWVPMRREGACAFLAGMAVAEFGRVGEWLQVAIAARAGSRVQCRLPPSGRKQDSGQWTALSN